MEEEEKEEIDIMDFLMSKGMALDPFKHEFSEMQRILDVTTASNIGKEREVDQQATELRMLREQLAFTRRNVDELISQQEVLKETIDNANSKKESLVEREQQNRQEIGVYQGYFSELREALSVGADWSHEQLEQRTALEKERDFVSSKLENKSNQLTNLRSDIERTYHHVEEVEKEIEGLEGKIDELEKRKNDIKRESSKLAGSKETTEKQIFDLRTQFVDKENELLEKMKLLKSEEKMMKHLDTSIVKSKHQMEIYLSEYEKLYRSLHELSSELEKQKAQNVKFEEEIQERTQSIELVEAEVKVLKKEITAKNQLREVALQKCIEVDKLKHEAESKIDQLNKAIAAIRDSDMLMVHKEIEGLEKQGSQLRQELDILRKKHIGSEKATKAITDLIILNKNGKLNLGLEIRILEDEIDHHKHNIRSLLSEKEKYEHDAEVANQQYYTSLEELKLQEMQIHELNKKITNDQMKLKQKQSLYESVRSDRNLFSKQLLDAQEEIQSLKRKFRSMNQQIDQMKEDISAKDHAIVKEHFLHHSVDKERELLKNELTKIRKQVQASEGIIENQRVEILKLQRIIDEADQERTRQRNELSSVLSERNLLTNQLMKRNEELNEMYEKIKTQRGDLKVGEHNFMKYCENMYELQERIRDLVGVHNDTIIGISTYDELKFKIVQFEKEILKEETKSRALMDELEVPMNVHRWRILESSDPKRYDKIIQIQSLQKQLVSMSDKVVQNDLLIQEKEKIYIELKNVIARHPGPEVEEQILIYQQTLKDKNKQLAAMNQELEMYIEQVRRFKEDIADYDMKMTKLNKHWMKTMKKARESQNF